MKKTILILAVIAAIFTFSSCQKFNEFIDQGHPDQNTKADAKVALDWYRLELRILLERNSAMNGVFFGYIGIGLYEAVRGENPHLVSFSSKLNQMPLMPEADAHSSYDWVISANAAMASLLRTFNTGLTTANTASIDSLENFYNQNSTTNPDSDKFRRSQTFGRSVATAIYNWSLTDNINVGNAGYVPPVFPGAWEPTPPAFANGVNPYVSAARLFLSANGSVVVPPPPFAYSETVGSDYYKMIKQVYDQSKANTTEQKNIASFWIDQGNGLGYTPPGHDFSAVTQIIAAKKVGLAVAAEVYAKCGIAERDGTIVTFAAKYKYNQMRPVTYIRRFIDTAWLPFITTPPHPEYPAAHAMLTGSLMQTASVVLGDKINFTDHSYDFRGFPSRNYTSIFGVAEEAGISRNYGGIHYIPSIHTGLDMARKIGSNIGNLKMSY
ncbi:MAG TPA: vanadium-dependent haloperoxidase [Puia sp.]|nr:vanadium-dependent haloperoxidase [Puia sp.]